MSPPPHPLSLSLTHPPNPNPVLNTTATLSHTTPLPAGTTRPQALALLADHLFFLACDPHMAQHELVPPSAFSQLTPPPSVPDDVRAQIRSPPPSSSSSPPPESSTETTGAEDDDEVPLPTCYRVTDVVHAIPAGIWDTRVVSVYEFTLIGDGVFVRIRSPMGVVLETFWRVREDADEGGLLVLVEDVTVRCSRLLVGIVRGQCEGNWRGIHGKVVARLERELGGRLE